VLGAISGGTKNAKARLLLPLEVASRVGEADFLAPMDLLPVQVIRTSLAPAELASSVRAALKPIAPNLPGKDFRTLQATGG